MQRARAVRDAPVVRSSSLRADTVSKSRDSSADALFTRELMASMQPTTCCVRALYARDFGTKFFGGATPDGCAVWLRALEL